MSRFVATLLGVAILCTVVVFGLTALVYERSQARMAAARAAAGVYTGTPMSMPAMPAPYDGPGPVVRVDVIGGMFETGFWNALSDRYLKETGVHIQLMATGPKNVIARAFLSAEGGKGADLITMHACDTIINLVADGYCVDPQPWMRNDLVIVGPAEDPAGIRGMTDAAAALKKIADAHAAFVVHSSLGAQEVLRGILEEEGINLDEKRMTILFLDNQRNVLHIAAQQHAYTMVGRIPFMDGKLQNEGLVLMVSGDERLRRPYVVAVANPERVVGVHFEEAKKLAAWMRSEGTQGWIAGYGKGQLDERALFFPVGGKQATTQPSLTANAAADSLR
jgi:tungstate transport system substrate-binding protein